MAKSCKQFSSESNFDYNVLFHTIMDKLEKGFERWDENIPFNNISATYSRDAIIKWTEEVLAIGRALLRIAHGLSIVNNSETVELEHLEDALEAYKRGVERYASNYVPKNEEW